MEIFHCQPCDRWLLECSNCKWSLDAPLRPPWVPSGSILLSPSLRGDGADSEASRSVSRVSNMRIHEPWLGSSQMAAMVILVVIKPSKLPFLWPPKKNMAKRIKNGGVRWSRITTTTWKTSCDPSDESSKVGGLLWQPKKKKLTTFGTFGSEGLRTRIFPQEKLHQILATKLPRGTRKRMVFGGFSGEPGRTWNKGSHFPFIATFWGPRSLWDHYNLTRFYAFYNTC